MVEKVAAPLAHDPLARLITLGGRVGLSTNIIVDVVTTTPRATLVAAASEKRPGLSRRKVYYLVRIKDAIEAGLITAAQVREVGWTKARDLADQALKHQARVTADDIHAARRTTVQELADDQAQAGPKFRLTFTLNDTQHVAVERALKAFGASANAPMPDRVKALTALCKAATNTNPKKVQRSKS